MDRVATTHAAAADPHGYGRKTLLVVDDEPLMRASIDEALRPHFRTDLADGGTAALARCRAFPAPDMILLDVCMPDMDGYEVCARLKGDPATAGIPVLFLSGRDAAPDVERGLGLGAVDYLTKPVIPAILLARVRNHLRLQEARELLTHHNRHLGRLVRERTRALEEQTAALAEVQDLAIVALGTLAETRDNETGNHIFRTQAYVKLLVERLGEAPCLAAAELGYEATRIWKSAPLHDIGKVGIPDHILLKPGRLTAAEFEIMKRHTELGRRALDTAESRVHIHRPYLRAAVEIAYCHHERWGGNGYPEGISGKAIPVSARLMAVPDTYDALVSRRVYKSPIGHAEAVAVIRDERGRQFAPDVVDCFIDAADEFREIAQRFSDAA